MFEVSEPIVGGDCSGGCKRGRRGGGVCSIETSLSEDNTNVENNNNKTGSRGARRRGLKDVSRSRRGRGTARESAFCRGQDDGAARKLRAYLCASCCFAPTGNSGRGGVDVVVLGGREYNGVVRVRIMFVQVIYSVCVCV